MSSPPGCSSAEGTPLAMGVTPVRLGPYSLDGLMRAEFNGLVYRAHKEDGNQSIAVKKLAGRLEGKAARRFIVEGRVLVRIGEVEGCLMPLDFSVHEGVPLVEQPLVKGALFNELIASEAEGLDFLPLIAEAAFALEGLHRHGLSVRYLAPPTLLLDQRERVRVLGLDCWTLVSEKTALSDALEGRAGAVTLLGMVPYLAPEVLQREWRHDPHCSDIFGLGAILYHVLCGRLPRPKGKDGLLKMDRPIAPIEQFNPELPPALVRLCTDALKFEPEKRVSSAQEFGERLLDEGLGAAPSPEGFLSRVVEGIRAWRKGENSGD